MRNVLAMALVVALTGCAGSEAMARIGKQQRTTGAQIVYAQRLVDLYGEGGAKSRLIESGWNAQAAAQLVLDAQAARGGTPAEEGR